MDITYFFNSSNEGHLGCFHLLSIMNNSGINIDVWVFVETYFFFISLEYISGRGILGYNGNFMANCFPKQLYHFTLPPAMYRSSNFSTSLPTLVIICHFF